MSELKHKLFIVRKASVHSPYKVAKETVKALAAIISYAHKDKKPEKETYALATEMFQIEEVVSMGLIKQVTAMIVEFAGIPFFDHDFIIHETEKEFYVSVASVE